MAEGDVTTNGVPPAGVRDTVFCGDCGGRMLATAKFCSKCGAERVALDDVIDLRTEPATLEVGATAPDGSALPQPTVGHDRTDVTTEVPVPVVRPESTATVADQAVAAAAEAEANPPEPKRRHRLWAGVAAAAAVVVLAVLAVALWPEADEVDVTAAVENNAAAVSSVMEDLGDVSLLADMTAIGEEAVAEVADLEADARVVSELSNDEERAALSALLDAEAAVLESVGEATEGLSARSLGDWPGRSRALTASVEAVADAQADVDALEISDLEFVEAVDADAALATIGEIDSMMADKLDEFTTWRDEADFITAAKEQEQATLLIYGDRARDLMDEYSGLRDDLQAFSDRIDREFVSIAEGSIEFDQAASGRRRILEQMSALEAPNAIAGAHTTLLSVLGDAVAGVESAEAGITQYLNDPFYLYLGVLDTPGWASFQAASSRITASMDSALSGWYGAVDGEANRLRAIEPPPRPVL